MRPMAVNCVSFPPLPKGEGRGEGEGSIRKPNAQDTRRAIRHLRFMGEGEHTVRTWRRSEIEIHAVEDELTRQVVCNTKWHTNQITMFISAHPWL
jgi:hypothetical protein